MGSKAYELRATTSLARLLAKQGKRDEARAMLAEIYNWFTVRANDPTGAKSHLHLAFVSTINSSTDHSRSVTPSATAARR